MKILSLFDGMGCSYLAFKRAGIKVDKYYASEIDKYSKAVAKHNISEYIDLGDINSIDFSKLDVDFVIGGSPCQDLSIAKKGREGLKGSRSSLFYKFVEAIETIKPKYYILENVSSMSVENINTISFILGSNPTEINSALVSAQNRKRLYWTSSFWQIPQPKDKVILLKDILESGEVDKRMITNGKSFVLTASYNGAIPSNSISKKQRTMVKVGNIGSNSQGHRVYSDNGKSVSLSANGGGLGAKTGLYKTNNSIRKLTPIECERLQTVPDNYTKEPNISDTQRYKMLGNGFTVDIIVHILRGLNE